ncbi:BtrH N-terminal domain-containing protein [Paenibacillus athensensis]|uniref:Butirosin biosynthesis protein H N-terminal domain-containing protein n=1 Tax=Paenibacillus athensensis TaxID=1967502 RepID=A0A4Y8QAL3_9BACL|nr:BtrH N-terminal domain-containing protein [Paenibacillus athensensis]MCD1257613.1 BtrH N-terminal domain-containing protein [Paenibacillus athensensis]
MQIIIPQMRIEAGAHCLFASLRNLLAAGFGIRLSEADIYFRCDGMNVEYLPLSRPYWIGRSGDAMMRQFAALGPVRTRYHFGVPEPAARLAVAEDIARELAAGRLALLFAHSGCLTYHQVYRDNPSRPHVIGIYGIDLARDTAYVIDSFLLDIGGTVHTYQGPAPLSSLLAGMYGLTYLEGPHAAGEWADADEPSVNEPTPIAYVRDGIGRFLGGSVGEWGNAQGLAAYRSFFERLTTVPELDDATFTQTCKELYYCLRIGTVMHQWAYLQQIVRENTSALRSSADAWLETFAAEEQEWQKHLLGFYKNGLRAYKANWGVALERSHRLVDRQAAVLRQFADDLIID